MVMVEIRGKNTKCTSDKYKVHNSILIIKLANKLYIYEKNLSFSPPHFFPSLSFYTPSTISPPSPPGPLNKGTQVLSCILFQSTAIPP